MQVDRRVSAVFKAISQAVLVVVALLIRLRD